MALPRRFCVPWLATAALLCIRLQLCAAVASSTALSDRHAYGSLCIGDCVRPLEAFRAYFGGLMSCGRMLLREALDGIACGELPTLEDHSPSLEGYYMVAHRGNCSFVQKALYAQAHGASGLIIVNNEAGNMRLSAPALRPPSESNASTPVMQYDATNVTIPVVMLSNSSAPTIALALTSSAPVYASLNPTRDLCIQSHTSSNDVPFNEPLGDEALLRSVLSSTTSTSHTVRDSRPTIGVGPSAARSTEMAQLHAGNWSAEACVALFSGPLLDEPLPVAIAAGNGLLCSDDTDTAYNGRMVLALRGGCSMIDKARAAQRAGARALVIVNNGCSVSVDSSGVASISRDEAGVAEVGCIQAIGDEGEAIHISVAMISAEAACGVSQPALPNGLRIHAAALRVALRGSAAPASAWDELRAAVATPATLLDSLPATDWYRRTRTLTRLLHSHHPDSNSGSAERWRLLLHILAPVAADAVKQLHDMAAATVWTSSTFEYDIASDGERKREGSNRTLFAHAVATSAITRRMPSSVLQRNSVAGNMLLPCSPDILELHSPQSHLKSHLQLRGHGDPFRRLQHMLHQHACLERYMAASAGAIGSMLALARHESDDATWVSETRSLVHPWRVAPSQLDELMHEFIDFAAMYELQLNDNSELSVDAVSVTSGAVDVY